MRPGLSKNVDRSRLTRLDEYLPVGNAHGC